MIATTRDKTVTLTAKSFGKWGGTGPVLTLLVFLYFVQIWPSIGGFTVRAEDVLIIAMWAAILCSACLSGCLPYRWSALAAPLVFWTSAIALGVVTSLALPYDLETHKNAVVNGARLVLACSLFPLVRIWPASATAKWRVLVRAILGVSFLTTAVALAQIAYWDGWLPLSLPSCLIEFRPAANTAPGREVFALFIGNTAAHTWSGMLALQALLVWLLAFHTRSLRRRSMLLFCFAILCLILIRVSVRNSILGLAFAVLLVSILDPVRYRDSLVFPARTALILGLTLILLWALLCVAPQTYFLDRVRQAIPRFDDGRLLVSRGSNVFGRVDYAMAAWRMFSARPLLGVGFYGYQAQSARYLGFPVVHAHNSFFQTMAEMGIVGIVALAWLCYSVGRRLSRSWRYAARERELRIVWLFAAGAVLFLGFTALFSNTLWTPQYVGMVACVVSVLECYNGRP